MKKTCLLGAVLAISFIGSVNASLIDITATSVDSRFTDFTLRFNDASGDGLLQINEVVLFSGFTVTNPLFPPNDGFYSIVIGTPNIAGISTASGINANTVTSNWGFKRFVGDTAECCGGLWTYTSAPAAIPVPAAVWLFGSGLLGLVGISRRKIVSG